MRSFVLVALICFFSFSKNVLAQEPLNLFIIEKPIETPQMAQLNPLFQQAMRDLLIRLVGGEQMAASEQGQRYIQKARQWVKSYQFANREADGVVIGQKLVVEFDRHRLLDEFQRNHVHIWPLNERPKTWVIGAWEQQGLRVNLTETTLQYRIDLDFRDIGQLLALPLYLPKDDSGLTDISLLETVYQESLPGELQTFANDQNYDRVLLFKADVIGEVVSFVWGVYDVTTGQRLLYSDETGEAFLDLVRGTFDSLLEVYSKPYRERAGLMGLVQLQVEAIPSVEALQELEAVLQRMRPTLHEVKLTRLKAGSANFDLVFQGNYIDVVKLMTRFPKLELLEESTFSGELKTIYRP